MNDLVFDTQVMRHLREEYPHYDDAAYLFLLSALHYSLERLEQPRHLTGPELAEGVRDLAIERFGPMARTVLEYWGIHSTEDMGEVVFALVDCGVLLKQDEDVPEDFAGVFDFDEAFGDYRLGSSF